VEKEEMRLAVEDLEFLKELQCQRLSAGMPEAEGLTLQIDLVTQFINRKDPVKSSCVVCTKESPATWKDARVDIKRQQVHCPTHSADFHCETTNKGEGCVSCDRYHPTEIPIKRLWLQMKQHKLIELH
jgi:hypothetical protein